MNKLGERVREAREALGWDQDELALAAGYSQPSISDIENGNTSSPRNWRKLAAALKIQEDEFRDLMIEASREAGKTTRLSPAFREKVQRLIDAEKGADVRHLSVLRTLSDPRADVALPRQPTAYANVAPNALLGGPVADADPNSIPVFGRVKGGDDGRYEFNGEVIGWVPRPAKLRGVPNVYAVYIDGESMYPRYKPGETAVAQPGMPVVRGDDVVVQLHADTEFESPYGFVKEFVAYTPTKLILSQFNPPQQIEFDRDEVVSVHRIVHADR